ncbi:MAG: tRNA (adenosine(37)-N6)-threonylcarbamoyltransferase complex ATPase subunit type 1 TsaE [Crocinitomicaceae bacterium]|nr:tRNA (adenosine(37)-N6)-threonylcarbamoyltransferase complex ATPase subunit type 1 TsaE [Crocinitomicaceae bacterium]
MITKKVVEYIVNDIDGLRPIAMNLLERLKEASIFVLVGEMGAGKTTFTQSILRAMGIEHLEGSPTYSLINEYESPFFGKVYHMDLYRLNSLEEALDIGIEELLYQNVICFIEWPEKILELLPDNTIWVYLRANEDLSRIITIKDEDKS